MCARGCERIKEAIPYPYTGMRLSKKRRPTRHKNKKPYLALPKTPIFLSVDAVLVWDNYMSLGRARIFEDCLKDHGGSYSDDLIPNESTIIIANSWHVVVEKWGWNRCNSVIQDGIAVVHFDWLVDSCAKGEVLPSKGFGLWISKKASNLTMAEKTNYKD